MSESSMIERVRPRDMQWLLVGLTLGMSILDAYASLWWLSVLTDLLSPESDG